MNGRTAKKLRMVTIGSHDQVVKERKGREYLWAMKKQFILKSPLDTLTDKKICVIVKGPRSTYQVAKEGYKNDVRSRKIKSSDLNRGYKIHRTASPGSDKTLLGKNPSALVHPMSTPRMGR